MGIFCISEPYTTTQYDIACSELFTMECNVRRMKYMISSGYYCSEYSDENWLKFKIWKNNLNKNVKNED